MEPPVLETERSATRIYDSYGSRDADSKRVSDLIAQAADVRFTLRVSADRGEYYLGKARAGEELIVESNDVEDEDGAYFKQPEQAGYRTLLLVWHKATGEAAATAVMDTMRNRLDGVAGLDFLDRRQSAKPTPGPDPRP